MPRPARSGCRSTRRIACIAKPATLRTRSRTSIGWYRKAAAGPITRTCSVPKHVTILRRGVVVRINAMANVLTTRWSIGGGRAILAILLANVFALGLGIAPLPAAQPPASAPAATQKLPAADADHLFGKYLAGRHAQQLRDFTAAARV